MVKYGKCRQIYHTWMVWVSCGNISLGKKPFTNCAGGPCVSRCMSCRRRMIFVCVFSTRKASVLQSFGSTTLGWFLQDSQVFCLQISFKLHPQRGWATRNSYMKWRCEKIWKINELFFQAIFNRSNEHFQQWCNELRLGKNTSWSLITNHFSDLFKSEISCVEINRSSLKFHIIHGIERL